MKFKRIKYKLKIFYKELIFLFAVNCKPFIRTFIKLFYIPNPNDKISIIIDAFSKKTPELTVIQVGANDGFNNDPIYKFIQRDNWKGILIEPQSHTFSKYLQRLYKNSKNIVAVHAAVGHNDGVLPLYKVSFCNERWATGLATFDKEGLERMVNDGSIENRAKRYGIAIPSSKNDYITTEQVQVISPETIKNKYNINQVDLFMIDTEGFDFEIIKMFLLANVNPEMIIFEHFHFSENEEKECNNFLASKNYLVTKIKGNSVALLNTSNNSKILNLLN